MLLNEHYVRCKNSTNEIHITNTLYSARTHMSFENYS